MAAQGNLKSAAITNMDATPPVWPTAGQEGGRVAVWEVIGIAGPTTSGATTGGYLFMVRLPSNAIVKKVEYVQKAATTTANFDFDLWYSDANDGTSALNQNTVVKAQMFGANVDTHAATTWTDITFVNTSGYLPTDTVNPLWKAANSGLTSDPGGFFDIRAKNVATISGAATLCLRVTYTLAGV